MLNMGWDSIIHVSKTAFVTFQTISFFKLKVWKTFFDLSFPFWANINKVLRSETIFLHKGDNGIKNSFKA